jgi:hypothetical protein
MYLLNKRVLGPFSRTVPATNIRKVMFAFS